MNESSRFLVSQFVHLLPTLFVLLIAIVLSIVCLGRARVPSLITLVAAVVWALASIAAAAAQASFLSRADSGELAHDEIGGALQVIGLVSSIVHAVCLALLVAAIFIGRKPSGAAAVA